eukprot:gene27349-biopygen10048
MASRKKQSLSRHALSKITLESSNHAIWQKSLRIAPLDNGKYQRTHPLCTGPLDRYQLIIRVPKSKTCLCDNGYELES